MSQSPKITARALLLGDRIDLAGLEREDVLSTNPLAFRSGDGFVVLFRYGVAVLVNLTPLDSPLTKCLFGPVGGQSPS